MLTEMKQNELKLLSQDLWGTSKTISDTISRPEILVDDYLETYAEQNLINGFEFFKDMTEE